MKARALILLLAAIPAYSAYQYYFTDAFASLNTNNWTRNGNLTINNSLTNTDGAGGSLIATQASAVDYEVNASLNLAQTADGGMMLYLRASSDALLAGQSTGTFYAAYLYSPVVSGNSCFASLMVAKYVQNVLTVLNSTTVPCAPNSTLRAVMRGTVLTVFINNLLYMQVSDSDLASGRPGVGMLGAPGGVNSIRSVSFGAIDTTPPGAVSASSVGTSSFANRVDLQWAGAGDGTEGIGIAFYDVYRIVDGVEGWVERTTQPTFADNTVSASTTYHYSIRAFDYHFNRSPLPDPDIPVTTPGIGGIDPRRVGVRSTGAYWGGMGEQIDTLSGNLNFALPLLGAKSRGSGSVPFSLNYNSQSWRLDGGGTWKLGRDVGYGYGWKLQAGSLTPYYRDYYALNHWVFTDSTGAEYRLDQNSDGVWTSLESVYVTYDSNVGRLYFNDGSFWVLGCVASGTEEDGGTQYPTVMQDSNGNQIMVRYAAGAGAPTPNSSGRILEIEDVRATGIQFNGDPPLKTYFFTYDASQHLSRIDNVIGTGEGYTFGYSQGTLNSPFGSGSFGTTSFLSSMSINGVGLQYQIATNSSGEVTRVTYPYGGYLRWDYTTWSYSVTPAPGGGSIARQQREVTNRVLSKDGQGASEKAYAIGHEANNAGQTLHAWTKIDDPSTIGSRVWRFWQTSVKTTLISAMERWAGASGPVVASDAYDWIQDPAGRWYIGSVTSAINGFQKKTEQTLDAYGNVTQSKLYNWNDLTTPARTYDNIYLTDANYTSRYIRNRLLTSTVKLPGGQPLTLVSNTYDITATNVCSVEDVFDPEPKRLMEHDSSYGTGLCYRGNLTLQIVSGTVMRARYDIVGNTIQRSINGVPSNATYDSTTHFAAPTAISTNSLTEHLAWNPFLGLTQVTGANNEISGTTFDNYARPVQTTAATGAVTGYSYSSAAPWTATATINQDPWNPGRWNRKTLDGFGRTVKVENGSGSTVRSQTETVFDSCACSPIGKVKSQSMPHAPTGTVYSTIYGYDALGRTLTVTQPDGSSIKGYAYLNNTVKVTDEAGKWKLYTMDALGNLTQVEEPNPAGGSWFTSYTYDILNHLTQVSMLRGAHTQTRTFNYGTPPGALLLSATNPESGQVTYDYYTETTTGRPMGLLKSKIDAKNQKILYTYDGYQRLTEVHYYAVSTGPEDTAKQVTLSYDSNPYDASYSGTFTAGRMTARLYAANGTQFTDMFQYQKAGQIIGKRLRVNRNGLTGDLQGAWGYDGEGRMTSVTYPSALNSGGGPAGGQSYTNTYDVATGVLKTMKDVNQYQLISADYGPAGELLSLSGEVNETRRYNSRLQLIQLNNTTFEYSGITGNNGRVQTETDSVSGETVTYQYDEVNRLTKAETLSPLWGHQFTYDGFGNLTGKSATAGHNAAPPLTQPIDVVHNWNSQYSYDPNGNQLSTPTNQALTYDYENRVSSTTETPSATGSVFGYAPDNRRVYTARWTGTLSSVSDEAVVFYGPGGQRMGGYVLQFGTQLTFTLTGDRVYFGGKLVRGDTGQWVNQDRVGSVGGHYPYGEDRGAGASGMFATYTRDSSGLDYAVNRYYSSTLGRFMSPDPYMASGGSAYPGSWNRYAYVENDPANLNDPSGATYCFVNSSTGTIASCYDSVEVTATLSAYGIGSGGAGGIHPNMSPLDPLPLGRLAQRNILAAVRTSLVDSIAYLGLGDCQALAQFASTAASLISERSVNTPDDFVASFGVLTPGDSMGRLSGIAHLIGVQTSGGYVNLNQAGKASTFLPGYQDSGPGGNTADQAHHFAFYFQLGYQMGALETTVIGVLQDLNNPGDRNLAQAAAQIGWAFKLDRDLSNVVSGIQGLCQK